MGGVTQPSFIFPLVTGTFTAVTYVFFVVVYTVQPKPFIDEAFHIPQAQKYCQGNFEEVCMFALFGFLCVICVLFDLLYCPICFLI